MTDVNTMEVVTLESPFAGDFEANIAYARDCVKNCLLRGEAVVASHLLYTQKGVLDDTVPQERQQGILAGLAVATRTDKTVVYIDRGISGGMKQGIEAALIAGRAIELRSLNGVVRLDALFDDCPWLYALVDNSRVTIDARQGVNG